MKTVEPQTGGEYLGTAAWYELEAEGIEFPFPKLFGRLGDEYDKRFGLQDEHLAHIAAVNYGNAKRNPKAQTRHWYMSKAHARCYRQVQHRRGRAHQGERLLPGHRRGRRRLPGLAALRRRLRAAGAACRWRRCRASLAGATAPRPSCSTTRSPRAPTAPTCCRTRAAPSSTPSRAPA